MEHAGGMLENSNRPGSSRAIPSLRRHFLATTGPSSAGKSNGRRTCIAGIANQLADRFLNLFPANGPGWILVEVVFPAQQFQIVTFLAFFL
jgi:hypothetical protein